VLACRSLAPDGGRRRQPRIPGTEQCTCRALVDALEDGLAQPSPRETELALSDGEEGCGEFERRRGRRKVPIGHGSPNGIREERLERHGSFVDDAAHLRILRREFKRAVDYEAASWPKVGLQYGAESLDSAG
jgi:hypothetical protein